MGDVTESVWDYPRPPRLERTSAVLEVVLGGEVVASTTEGYRVLETSHPPTYYLPPTAFAEGVLRPCAGFSVCEWKGAASYFDLVTAARVAPKAAWTYLEPTPGFAPIAGYVAVMAGHVDECRVDGEVVTPQPGGFYGGWITSDLVGPFKGGPGTGGW
jgi:uncharacterized protein (DUF427 family)